MTGTRRKDKYPKERKWYEWVDPKRGKRNNKKQRQESKLVIVEELYDEVV